ncbi:MAG: hypothetical protein Q7S09_00410 [bacterium]|nr:hypothetical protein [bacterium]
MTLSDIFIMAFVVVVLAVFFVVDAKINASKPYVVETVIPNQVVMLRANKSVGKCLSSDDEKAGLKELAKTYNVLGTGASVTIPLGQDSCTESVLVSVEPI